MVWERDSVTGLRAEIRRYIAEDDSKNEPLRKNEIAQAISALADDEATDWGDQRLDQLSERFGDVVGYDGYPKHPYWREMLVTVRNALRERRSVPALLEQIKAQGLSREEIADALDVNPDTVWRWERGRHEPQHRSRIELLAGEVDRYVDADTEQEDSNR